MNYLVKAENITLLKKVYTALHSKLKEIMPGCSPYLHKDINTIMIEQGKFYGQDYSKNTFQEHIYWYIRDDGDLSLLIDTLTGNTLNNTYPIF